jgi:cytoskeletal protein RodZ
MGAMTDVHSIGNFLKHEREVRHISLGELSQVTRIPLRQLELLEEDRFDDLPGEVFARGFIKSYARAVGVDEAPLLARFDRGRTVSEPPAPITAVTSPERGRRFGIALALVILLILFTLALSIVLRPRHRDTPIELSYDRCEPCQVLPPSPMPSSCAASTTPRPIASLPC